MKPKLPTVAAHELLELDATQAWTKLRSRSLGRLAVSSGGQPGIFPVNYLASEHSILIRTSEGTKVAILSANELVAFETDDASPSEGWSVVVKGIARRLEDEVAIEEARNSRLWTWAPIATDVFIRVLPTDITGRYFHRD